MNVSVTDYPIRHFAGGISTRRASHVVGVVTICRGQLRNTLDLESICSLVAAIQSLDGDEEIRSIVLTASGNEYFCAGADLGLQPLPDSEGQLQARWIELIGMERRTPLIGAVNGDAFGAGFELALSCDILIASAESRFALTELLRGRLPSTKSLRRVLAGVPVSLMNWLLLSRELLTASRAYQLGLVSALETPGMVLDEAISLAEDVGANAPLATERLLHAGRRWLACTSELSIDTDLV